MDNGLTYLNSLGLHKVKPGLERIKSLLNVLGNPQDKVPGIIIAGTNGKGSVAAAIASILSAQGYKVGLYTSPHLISITERIKINDVQISESDLNSILVELKEAAEKAQIEPSYFEIITAAAFLYFAREKVDFNVLEVGLGGRWDATNVITPLLSVITNITLEHTEYLGDTIAAISAEKACIIKPSIPIVTAVEGEAFNVIEQQSIENASPLLRYRSDFFINSDSSDSFHYKGILRDFRNLKSNLKGSYQTKNLALAIAAIEILKKNRQISISEQSIRDGLSTISWEGRFEVLRDNPPLILDSAHNPGAAKSLVESLVDTYPNTKFSFLIGMLDDKGHSNFLKEISSITEKLIITRVPSERTAYTQELKTLAQEHIDDIEIIEDYEAAYSTVLNLNRPSCITGSLYLVGAIKNLIQNP
ncbi:MAG: folylpolyglutamate synthase/dihydrofolate synthase family protein [Thermodesulfobacteriota bacterium]